MQSKSLLSRISHTISGGGSSAVAYSGNIRRRLHSATNRKRFPSSDAALNIDTDINRPLKEESEENDLNSQAFTSNNFKGPVTSTTYANLLPYESDDNTAVENITSKLVKSAKCIEKMIFDLQVRPIYIEILLELFP